jgi:hypothetical protein
MIDLILWLWQFPQNFLGFIFTRFADTSTTVNVFDSKIGSVPVWYMPLFRSGVSLGDYIILDNVYITCPANELSRIVSHESGHQKQSLMLGPLYLIAVGFVSAARNIWDRLFHGKWDGQKRTEWYYGGWPEKQADKLGRVERF